MNILICRNQPLQEVTTAAYFCDISNATKTYILNVKTVYMSSLLFSK